MTNKKEIDTFTKASVLREVLRTIDDYNCFGKVLSDFYNNKQKGEKCLNSLRNIYAHTPKVTLEQNHNKVKCKFIREESTRQLVNLERVLDK